MAAILFWPQCNEYTSNVNMVWLMPSFYQLLAMSPRNDSLGICMYVFQWQHGKMWNTEHRACTTPKANSCKKFIGKANCYRYACNKHISVKWCPFDDHIQEQPCWYFLILLYSWVDSSCADSMSDVGGWAMTWKPTFKMVDGLCLWCHLYVYVFTVCVPHVIFVILQTPLTYIWINPQTLETYISCEQVSYYITACIKWCFN